MSTQPAQPSDNKIEGAKRSKRPKKPLWRRVLRGVGIFLAVLLALPVLAIGFLHSDSGQNLLRDKIRQRLAGRRGPQRYEHCRRERRGARRAKACKARRGGV